MNKFSITQLQQFSGIKAHTIRIWEQRYKALTPDRTEGNTRYYDNAQLRRLLNIVSLMGKGKKISELGSLSDAQLYRMIDLQTTQGPKDENDGYYVSQLIAAGMAYDEGYFDKIFSSALLRFGMQNAYLRVIYPMLERIGLMWTKGSLPPAQEHFISNLICRKMHAAIDALPPPQPREDTWMLFLPEDEYHEIGLLCSHYLIRKAGKKTIYLGCSVPTETLISAVEEIKPERLLFFLVHHNDPEETRDYIDQLKREIRAVFYVSGDERLISQLTTGNNPKWVKSVEQLERLLLP